MVLLNVIFAKPQSDTNDYKQTLHSLHSLTRIIQLSLRLFFKTSKHTRAADRPDDVVTSFVKPALRLQAPLLSRVCVPRVCTWGWESVCAAKTSRSLFQGNVQMRSAAGPFAYLYTCEPRGFLCCMLILPPASLSRRETAKGKQNLFSRTPKLADIAFEGFCLSLRETINKL